MNVVIYTRVSTQEQVDSGAGLNAQLDACVAYAKQQGWNVIGEYQDAGVSCSDLQSKTPQPAINVIF